ncbi:MAG: glycosyltransferase [Acidobacteria bacterium]|nr:glycosyltransferase [Acidobacteriota bacterium]
MKPLIIFYTTVLSATGGGQHAMSLLVQELAGRGYDIKLFTRPPFNPQHRYIQWLNKIGVPVGVWPRYEELRMARWLRFLASLLLVLPYALWRRHSLQDAWQAVGSIVLTRLSRLEKRRIFKELSQTIAGRDQVILQIWGPAALTPRLLEWAEQHGVYSIYHEMGEADELYIKTWQLESTVAAINKAQRVICCSRSVADCLRRIYGYKGEIATIPFMIQDPGERALKTRRNGDGRVNFGAIGRLVPHKRHQDLMLALRNLCREGHDVGLVIAGDGPMREALQEFARQQGVEDRVTFTGEFEKLEDVMQQFDVFTLTSASESQCMPITESMSYGKPVIASNFGGIPDFVEDGVTGYLVDVGDIDALTERFRIMVESPERRVEMGQRGREHYVRDYTPTAVTDAMERVYRSLPEDYPSAGLRLGYFVECYATFVVNEILELRKQGAAVSVFNAFRPAIKIDPVKESLRQESFYFAPYYRGVLTALGWVLLRKPLTFLKLLIFLFREPEASLRMLILAAYYAKRVRRDGITHLHATFGTRTTTLAYLTAELAGVDFSFTTHAYDIFNPNPSLVWKTSKARFMRTISAFNKHYIGATYKGIETKKIIVNYLGVDTNRLSGDGEKAQFSAPCYIISIGTLMVQKGHSYLIRACKELRDRGLDLRCEIIGDGNLEKRFQDEIEALEVAETVTLCGSLPNNEVIRRLQKADLFVLACLDMRGQGEHIDGIPVALMEAMAMGLPVVSTPLSGIPELIEDGVSGLLVPEKDEVGLADTIEHLIQDVEFSRALGCAARRKIEVAFDLTKNTRQLAAIFQNVEVSNG